MAKARIAHSELIEKKRDSERILTNQREEELIEIDENGVAHTIRYTPSKLKSTVLRDPEGEYAA